MHHHTEESSLGAEWLAAVYRLLQNKGPLRLAHKGLRCVDAGVGVAGIQPQ